MHDTFSILEKKIRPSDKFSRWTQSGQRRRAYDCGVHDLPDNGRVHPKLRFRRLHSFVKRIRMNRTDYPVRDLERGHVDVLAVGALKGDIMI